VPSRESGNGRLRSTKSNTAAVLDAVRSVELRDKLLAEVASLASADFAVTWAARALPAKNSLIASDAKLLEDAFEQKLSGLSSPVPNDVSAGGSAPAAGVASQDEPQASGAGSGDPRGIDNSLLTVAAPLSQPGAPALCCPTSLPRLRPQAIGPASSSIRAATGART